VARNAHSVPFKTQRDKVQLVAVCDETETSAKALADGVGGDIAILSDPAALLARPDVEAVVVTTPHYLHAPLAEACVAAGKPVLVEKPLVCTMDELRALRQSARAAGVPVVAAQMRRFEPEVLWLRDWIKADPANFGELRSFDIQSWQNLGGYYNRSGIGLKHWLLDGERAGGGVVISLAIHQLDLIRFLFDADYVSVSAHGRFDAPFHNGAESAAVAILSMSNGATGVLHANYLAPRVPFCEALSAFGSNGTIIQHIERHGDYRGAFKYASTGGAPTTEWNQQFTGFETIPPAQVGSDHTSFVNQTLAFAELVRSGGQSRNSIDENFNTIAVVDAIARSIRTGETVAVERI
jgi:predicted dehydrogenase